MIEAAGRSRLLSLRRDLASARAGRDLLDRKREAILRAVTERLPRVTELGRTVSRELAAARAVLGEAQVDLGRTAVDAAALAQPPIVSIEVRETMVVGVRLPQIGMTAAPFRPRYGPMSGSPRLDQAGAAFTAILPSLLALASEEASVRRLRAALARTVRRVNALDVLVLPELSDQIHTVAAALEEEDRDEAVRRRQWLESRGTRRLDRRID